MASERQRCLQILGLTSTASEGMSKITPMY